MQKSHKKIIIFSPRQWNLQWGQEKDIANMLKDEYDITMLELFDNIGYKKVYRLEGINSVLRRTRLKPSLAAGIVHEFRNLKDSLKYSYDILISYLPAGSLIAMALARLRGKKVLLIYADDYPELHKNISYLGYIVTKYFFNPLSALFASKIVVTARLLADDIAYFGKKPIYLPNGVDLKSFGRATASRPKRFTLCYMGAFGKWVNFEMIINYAREHPKVNFDLLGDGEMLEKVKKSAAGLKNVKFTGMIPRDDAREYARRADACIIPFKILRLTDRVSPIKLFEYWALRKPVISTSTYEIKKTGDGIVLFADSQKELHKAITRLREDKQFYAKVQELGYEEVKKYDWHALGKKYKKLLNELYEQ